MCLTVISAVFESISIACPCPDKVLGMLLVTRQDF
jgi:hypothetical protein